MSGPGVCHLPLLGGRHIGFRLVSPGGRVEAHVAPFDGGGVTSLRVAGRELLYRADQFEPPADGGWQGRAPLLWPAVGRNFTPAALTEPSPACCFEHAGRVYAIPIHGFAMRRAWTPLDSLTDAAGSQLTLGLADDRDTLAVFPFPFQLRVTHRVEDWGLLSTVEISSPTGLPCCVGNHITLALPPAPAFDAIEVRLPATVRHGLTRQGLLSGETTAIDLEAGAHLGDEGLLNAVTGGLSGAATLTLTSPDGLRLSVGQEVLTGAAWVDPDDLLFVFWGSRECAYWCPEPWLGRPNGLQDGCGRVDVPPGEVLTWAMRVEVESI